MTAKQLGESPAFPVPPDTIGPSGEICHVSAWGLTKREEFAKAALQGLLKSDSFREACGTGYKDGFNYQQSPYESVARTAIAYADALLAELAKDSQHA